MKDTKEIKDISKKSFAELNEEDGVYPSASGNLNVKIGFTKGGLSLQNAMIRLIKFDIERKMREA